jgi:nitrogen fixation protein FixH
MKKAQQQKALGWRITVDGLDGIQINETRSVSVAIIDAADQPLNNASVHIALLRPGARQAAQQWTLHNTVSTGNYSAALKIGEAGQWLALISITRGQDKFETAKEIIVAAQSQ